MLSFEFGISLNEIEFVQNIDGKITEEQCINILNTLILELEGKIDHSRKMYGMVVKHENLQYNIYLKPYKDDFIWDFEKNSKKFKVIL